MQTRAHTTHAQHKHSTHTLNMPFFHAHTHTHTHQHLNRVSPHRVTTADYAAALKPNWIRRHQRSVAWATARTLFAQRHNRLHRQAMGSVQVQQKFNLSADCACVCACVHVCAWLHMCICCARVSVRVCGVCVCVMCGERVFDHQELASLIPDVLFLICPRPAARAVLQGPCAGPTHKGQLGLQG